MILLDIQNSTKVQNKKNIQEQNEIDHDFNMELSILNIKNPTISFFSD